MDRIFSPHSPEATAHQHFTENWFDWDKDHTHLDEVFVAGSAAYQAFDRYLKGADIFILPRNRTELESILKRYSYDAIHNTIAKARSQVLPGGYGRMCEMAENSIRDVLDRNDIDDELVSLHHFSQPQALSPSPPRTIKTK